jgi:hypothetical protein
MHFKREISPLITKTSCQSSVHCSQFSSLINIAAAFVLMGLTHPSYSHAQLRLPRPCVFVHVRASLTAWSTRRTGRDLRLSPLLGV